MAFFLAAITNTKVYQKKTLHVLKSKSYRGVDVCCSFITTSFITNTSEDKPLKCTEQMDHLHWNDEERKKQWQYKGHNFQAKCREFSMLTVLWPLVHFPLTTTAGSDMTRQVWRDRKMKTRHETYDKQRFKCCVLHFCLNAYSSLVNWMTAQRWVVHRAPSRPNDSTF